MIYLFLAAAFIIHSTFVFVVNLLSVPSEIMVFFRAALGFAVCVLFLLFTKRKSDKKLILKNLKFSIFSSIALLFAWNFLYKAIASTSMTFSLLVFSVLFPLLYALSGKCDKLKRILTLVFCAVGEIFLFVFSALGKGRVSGFLMSLLAAFLVLVSVAFDRRVKKISFVESLSAKFMLISVLSGLYAFLFIPVTALNMGMKAFFLLIVLGVVHTGVFYFLAMCFWRKCEFKTLSALTLISPVLSLIFSIILVPVSFEAIFLVPVVFILILPFVLMIK